MTEWEKICDYLLHSDECRTIHKLVWRTAGEAYLSGIPFVRNGLPYGKRIKLTEKSKLEDVKEIVRYTVNIYQ